MGKFGYNTLLTRRKIACQGYIKEVPYLLRRKYTDTPLLSAMLRYVDDQVMPFHTPGHKMGKGIHPVFGNLVGKRTLELDLALMDELDDLQEPHSCIMEAQEMAAELYGADHSFFVINGTTGGIYAMILSVVGPGDKILIPRNAHRSIIGGIILSGAVPVFMHPEVDLELGIAMGVSPLTVSKVLKKHPDAKSVLIINPTYYGVATDLRKIADIVHSYHIPLIVDEAHGPHLKFSETLPLQAIDAGADICAQSTHKIIGAMTQASMVHCREGRISVPRLKAMLQLVQSTSPNYVMLASLDVARMQMATQGTELISRAISLANKVRQAVNSIPGLYCFGDEKLGNPGVYSIDPTKVTVTVKSLGIKGNTAEMILRDKYKVQAELSDIYNLLFLFTLGDDNQAAERLIEVLTKLAHDCRGDYDFSEFENTYKRLKQAEIPEQVVSPREAMFSNSSKIAFTASAGRICSEIVTFYPPGIPLLCPGERITRDIIVYCEELKKSGLHVSGPEDATLNTIKVVS